MQQTTQRRIGRPRDPQVKARDEVIYQLIADGVSSRKALARTSGFDPGAVHLSCKRLQKQDRVRTCLGDNGSAVWSVADGTPCD
jgi:hypothetical protein